MTSVFISVPVADQKRSNAFYSALGFTINPAMSDHNGTCFIIEADHSYLMVLTREFFQSMTKLTIGDPAVNPSASVSVFLDSKEEVDSVVAAGLAAGGAEPHEATDYGFMYQRGIDDPDGNSFEFGWFDPSAAAPASK
jgi:predicted lactoylglutathione lyase